MILRLTQSEHPLTTRTNIINTVVASIMDYIGTEFPTVEEAYATVETAQKALGFVVIKCSSKHHNGRLRTLQVRCQHSGPPRRWGGNKGRYNTTSRKTDCPFKVNINFSLRVGRAALVVKDATHNHQPVRDEQGNPVRHVKSKGRKVGDAAAAAQLVTAGLEEFEREEYDAETAASWRVCCTCGTQFPTADADAVTSCHICSDPRQFVPPTGQSFTTLGEATSRGHRNEFTPYAGDPRIVFIETTPKFGIGQRAMLVGTARGNILWDCIALLDGETVGRIVAMGGLRAMVISHPHFYSTHVQWARAFGCPVYIAAEDQGWRTMQSSHVRLVTETETAILGPDAGVKAIKLGGHFPGSMVLHFDGRLLVADTLMTTPAGLGSWPDGTARPPGLSSYAFLWSIPNMIPLGVDELWRMWGVLGRYGFRSTHGGFRGMDIEDPDVKARVLESMQIQCRAMGHANHPLLHVSLAPAPPPTAAIIATAEVVDEE